MARAIDIDAALDRYYAEWELQDICSGDEDRDWLMKCINEAPTIEPKQAWISIDDRLPEKNQKALCVSDKSSFFVSVDNTEDRLIMKNGKWRIWSANDNRWRTFTHWMPISELQKCNSKCKKEPFGKGEINEKI